MCTRLLTTALLSVAIVLAGFFVRSGLIAWKMLGASVEVRGLAERKVLSDYGQWTPRFRIVANTIQEVQKSQKAVQNTVKAFLEAQGFTDKEITFLPMTLEDLESNAYNTNKYRFRYSGTIPVVITTSDVKKLDTTVKQTSTLYEKGLNLLSSNVNYEFTKLNDIKPEMLKEATESARVAGETFTKDSKTKLGKLKEASQGLFTISSEYGTYEAPSMYKNIRVVTRATYELE